MEDLYLAEYRDRLLHWQTLGYAPTLEEAVAIADRAKAMFLTQFPGALVVLNVRRADALEHLRG